MSGPRLRGSVWQLHDRVPEYIAQHFSGTRITVLLAGEPMDFTVGKQVKLSLRTSDRRTAIERHRAVKAQIDEAFTRLKQSANQGPAWLTDLQCAEIAGEYFRLTKAQHIENTGDPEDWDGGNDAAIDLGLTPKGREKMHGADADRLLLQRGLIPTAESRERLLYAMHKAYLDAAQRIEAWSNGNFAPMHGGEDRYPIAAKITPKPELTLGDVHEAWISDRQASGVPARTISTFAGSSTALCPSWGPIWRTTPTA
jgi:hypothetical protein